MGENEMQFPTNGLEFNGNNFLAVFKAVVDDFLKNSRSSERQEFVFKKSFGDNVKDKDVFIELVKAGVVQAYESNRVEARVYDWRSDRIEKPLLILFKRKEFPVEFDSAKLAIPKIKKSKYDNIPRNPQCSISDKLGNEFNRILDLVGTLQVEQLKSEIGYSDGDDAYFNLLLKILDYDDQLPKKASDRGFVTTINQKEKEDIQEYPDDHSEDVSEFIEGKDIEKKHKSKERNPQLILRAKEIFKKKHGRLFCQVCLFDFSNEYGTLGEDYIEGHHTLPVSEMIESHVSLVKDIALVCANCHRMLHRSRPWVSMDELKTILNENRKFK